ncbi:hypothetical protein BDF19DRAFT_241488 [Syncephalis fuscata]|nr:hypothetical protein BDF19DRAFT_241488 [Syncephalis fuscata]
METLYTFTVVPNIYVDILYNQCLFILHALGSFIYIWLFGSLEADLRTLAFVAGFLAVVLDLVVIPSNFGDLSYHIIIQISTILCSIAFYFLLVIWCSLKLGKQIERRIRLFRIVIHIGFAMRIIIHTAVLIIVAVDCYDTDHIVNIIVYNILGYFLISQQLLTALIFAYFTVVFYLSMKNCISESLRNALARLAIISTASFVAFLLNIIDVFLLLNLEWSIDADKMIARLSYNIVGLTIVSAVLLYVLGIRMPDYGKTSSETIIVSPLFAYRLLWSEIKARLFNKVDGKPDLSIASPDSITTLSYKRWSIQQLLLINDQLYTCF